MSETPQGWLEKVYEATGEAGLMEAYGGWAESYDRDLAQSGYSTPIEGLYLCGAGTHPGGEVTGAPGHNAAKAILRLESS